MIKLIRGVIMTNLMTRKQQQEVFNPKEKDFKKIYLDDEWNIYNNVNMSIHVTDKCNADCGFCIAHLRYLNDGLVYLKPEIENEDKYYQRLDEILNLTKKINPSVSITGGEPTVSKKLPTILKILAGHNVRKRTITTNGTGLFLNIGSGKTVLDALSDYKLEHLNVSRAHFNNKLNADIMVMKEHLMPEGKLEEIIQEAKLRGIKTRLSCALLKNGISSIDDIMRYTEWGLKIGVDNVIFRQLMKFDDKKVKPGRIPNYCKEEEIDLMPIWEFFDSRNDFELYHQVLGYYYYVEVRKYKGINVVSETADLRIINSQLKYFKDKFKKPTAFEMVFHPNGNLCAGWNENEQIMSELK
jgi:molybdenum cofactor biosynthesis enzyme MoaA